MMMRRTKIMTLFLWAQITRRYAEATVTIQKENLISVVYDPGQFVGINSSENSLGLLTSKLRS
jgi:hypothetical protein